MTSEILIIIIIHFNNECVCVSIYVCIYICVCVCVCMYVCMCVCVRMYVCMYVCMTTSMYCLYVGFDYTYIDINALAQGIKSFLASQVWFQAIAGARTYGTDSAAITSQLR